MVIVVIGKTISIEKKIIRDLSLLTPTQKIFIS